MTVLSHDQLLSLVSRLGSEPVLSVYVHGSTDDPSSRQWRIVLDQAIAACRAGLPAIHATKAQFDQAVTRLQRLLVDRDAGLGAPGWVAFIGPRDVFHAAAIRVRVPTRVVWGTGPRVAPLVLAGDRGARAILALIDARRVEIFEYADDTIQRIEEIRAHHVSEQPAHLGRAAQPGFHVGTRGGTGRDRLQRALREVTTRMERVAAETILRHATGGAWVLVAGTPQHRRELSKRLAPGAGGRMLELPHVDIHATPAQLAAAAAEGCETLRDARVTREIAALIELAGARGPACVGLEATKWRLAESRVQALFLTRRFVEKHPADAESVVASALAQDSTVDVVEGSETSALDEHGGVGARLRYRVG